LNKKAGSFTVNDIRMADIKYDYSPNKEKQIKMNNKDDNIVIALNDTKAASKPVVTALDFEYKEKSSKFIITTNAEAIYEVNEDEKGKIIINIDNVRIPKRLTRFMDTSEFQSNITYIEPKKTENGVSIEITLRKEVPFGIVQDENKIYVEIENPYEVVEKIKEEVIEKLVPVEVAPEGGDVIASQKGYSIIDNAEPEAVKKAETPKSLMSEKQILLKEIKEAYRSIESLDIIKEEEKKVFVGTKMSLDFKDADIHNVLRLISEVSGLNVVTSDEVKGKVSIHLSNVPWDQALDVILNVKDLGMIKKDNIILVIPKGKIEAEEERKRTALKQRRDEKLEEIKKKQQALEELEPLVLKIVPVNYSDVTKLEVQLKPFLSDRGSVSVDERTSVLIIKDVQENVDEAVAMVEELDSVTPQVLIEARIVEANTNFTRQLGVQWGGAYYANSAYGNALPYNFPNSFNVGGAAGSGNYVVDLPADVNQNAGGALGFTFGHITNTLSLDMRLSAMETSGEGKIISSPRIVTLDNIEAVIEQGTSIPYETTSQEGTETEFVDANLSLTVTPHITPDGSVKMTIKASKNSPNMTIVSNGEPAIDKKEARTEILVKDGETTVIGGIYVVDESEAEGGVPFFSKLPFIGWMFKVEQKIKTRSELLIFITPRIIEPGDQESL
jgi:type IV pilus assembly protein PilQ